MHIGLLLGSLGVGGAERQFVCLAKGLVARSHRVTLVRLFRGGALEEEVRNGNGLETMDLLGVPSRHPFSKAVRASKPLINALLGDPPDVLYSSGFLTNHLAARAARVLGIPVVWGVRTSGRLTWKTTLHMKMGMGLGQEVALTICNSKAGLDTFRAAGYLSSEAVVIPNGIALDRFRPCPEGENPLKRRLGVSSHSILVGLIGRLTPEKDHATFLRAAALASKRLPELVFVCLAAKTPVLTRRLFALSSVPVLKDRLFWIQGGVESEEDTSSLDILCSSSTSEGFANVIGEAMACEVPCVATDVGDSAFILGGTGVVVPPRNPRLLADGLLKLASLSKEERRKLGGRARARIQRKFSLEQMILGTEAALAGVIGAKIQMGEGEPASGLDQKHIIEQ